MDSRIPARLRAARRSGLVAGAALAALGAAAAPASAAPSLNGKAHAHRVCGVAPAGSAACSALLRDDATSMRGGKAPTPAVAPAGYGPADITAAYGLGGGSGQTVAIVDAYDDPKAEADLGVYRSQYGLPACTTANTCFTKIGQTGSTTSLPRANGGWAQEISLDLDMVSAACPGCKILLVEARSASFTDLAAAVNTAAARGAVAISNSYGGSDTSASSAYNHKGIAITASTGDSGYGVQSPASYGTVIAVGGTSLARTGSGFSETAWSGAGSGCSTINANPGWQTGTSCAKKATADVSAVADPNTGVAVYDSYAYQGYQGWLVFGGTSASSPIVASAYALGGNHGYNYPAQWTWANTSRLHDVTSGSNGTCSTSVWCTAGIGWDGPTGLGTPNGLGAF